MNHKKAMPATGTKFSASATLFELVFSHVPASSGSARTESRNNTRLVIRRTEKRMPAMAAAPWRLQARTDQVCFLLLLTLATAFWPIDRCNPVAVPRS